MDLALNLTYTILWTVESVTMPRRGYQLYLPPKENISRLIISGIIILFTLMEIKKQVTSKKNVSQLFSELSTLSVETKQGKDIFKFFHQIILFYSLSTLRKHGNKQCFMTMI